MSWEGANPSSRDRKVTIISCFYA